jgi:hypothetical protein
VLEPPLSVEPLDPPAGVLGDLAAAVRAEAGVIVDGIVGEVGRDPVDVARVERLVVAADVGERVDLGLPRSSLG